jgi:DNA-binding response OmpR family regulator
MKRKWGFTPLSFLLFENTNKTLTFVCYNTLKLCEEVGAMFKILVVEDDKELNRTVCAYLGQNGYETLGCLSANEAYDAMYGGTVFDMIISDIMMPQIDGFEFAKTVRELNEEIPILFMTARDDFASKQRGFRVGIDDYMVKPIDLDELLLRIGALLRRAKIAVSKKLTVGNLILNAEERSACLGEEEISLTVREFNLLYKLLSYPKKTFTRSQLMDEFWDSDTSSGPRTVDVYMTKLRDKFSGCDDFEIVTVHGLGYKAVIK